MGSDGAYHVLSSKLSGGPHGLGDPDDTTLRKVEREILIPKIIRDVTRLDKCAYEVGLFNKCVKQWPFWMFVKCRKENNEMKKCQEYWYFNKEFKEFCKNIYLKERSEFRRTGITKKQKEATAQATQENVQ